MGLLDEIWGGLKQAPAQTKSDAQGLINALRNPAQTAQGLLDNGAPYRNALASALSGNFKQAGDYLNTPSVAQTLDPTNVALTFGGMPMLAGHTVWHGSPHKFDKFDMSKIGTGEGAQAYGHGLYFAENPNVAAEYKNALSGDALVKGENVAVPKSGSVADVALAHLASAPSDANPYRWAANSARVAKDDSSEVNKPFFDKVINAIAGFEGKGIKAGSSGQMYKVDIPDEILPHMLDWDKPLSQQHPDVVKAFNKINKYDQQAIDRHFEMQGFNSPFESPEDWKVGDFFTTAERLGDEKGWLSDHFQRQGIPGIRYLDGNSRDTGGTSNFVLFNDQLPRILERNGVPTGQQPWSATGGLLGSK